MKISTHNRIYSFIERISIFFTLVLIGIFIIAGFIRFSNQKNINNPNNSIGDNVGNVVRITTCGQLHILSAIFPDYMLYVRGYGSGITIGDNYILSSAHIVYNEKQLPFINDKHYAKVIKKDKNSDLLLLKISNSAKSFKLANSITIGEKVIIWGYPAGCESFIFGRVANFTEEIIFLDAKVIKGMSGGAVMNEKGELLGVFKGGIGEPDMLGLAVNFPRIKKFLKGTPAEYK
jgi:S1-C subfamily serine protease